jgi:hypothetical protein
MKMYLVEIGILAPSLPHLTYPCANGDIGDSSIRAHG